MAVFAKKETAGQNCNKTLLDFQKVFQKKTGKDTGGNRSFTGLRRVQGWGWGGGGGGGVGFF